MKVIDLYNKIANGEEIPEKFKYEDVLYTREPMSFFDYTYVDENDKLFEDAFTLESLNDEIEIVEEEKKIPEKLYAISKTGELTIKYPDNVELMNKINEVIDYLKSKSEE